MFVVQRPLHTSVFINIVVSTHACTLFAMRVCTSAEISCNLLPNLLFLQTFRIDQKVSSSPTGYKLQDPEAILNEVRSIRDTISSGEREKQELLQVGAGVVTLVMQVAHTIYLFYILVVKQNRTKIKKSQTHPVKDTQSKMSLEDKMDTSGHTIIMYVYKLITEYNYFVMSLFGL